MRRSNSFDAFLAHQNGCVVVKVCGEVDMAVAADFETVAEVAIAASPHVVFDMAEVTFLDSSGLRVLIHTLLQVGDGGTITIRNTPVHVARVIQVAGMTGALKVELSH